MRRFLDFIIRLLGSVLAIQFMNALLMHFGMNIYVGINGYTLLIATVLGLPGILGLYVIGYIL